MGSTRTYLNFHGAILRQEKISVISSAEKNRKGESPRRERRVKKGFIMKIKIFFSRISSSSLFRAAGTYGFFSLLNSAIAFLLMPVFTRLLSPADYGIIAIFGVMLTILSPFIALDSIWGVSRAFFLKDRFDNASYLGTVFLFGVQTCLLITCFYLFQQHLQGFLFPEKWICLCPWRPFPVCH